MPTPRDRRTFLKTAAASGLAMGWAARVDGFPAFIRPQSPSDKVVVGVMGVNGRGTVLAETFALSPNTEVAYICDVDARARDRVVAAVKDVAPAGTPPPKGVTDFRRILDDQSVDALVIAAPDFWHATATILALQAGKHVYGEKPGSHNAREGELVALAQTNFDRIVQMGNQQRSGPRSIQIIQEIHEGLIGRPYFGRAWYANTRGGIGHGKPAAVPDWLDYELWQGPAPRTPYRDNVVHYNWHWFWRWGTGEICNNATHEIDVCRWALQVDFPTRVTSSGGRFHFDDDWQMYDTQVASYEFENGTNISWEGRSCNGRPVEGRSRGASIHGENGTVILDRDGYEVYDNDNRLLRKDILKGGGSAVDTRGGGRLTEAHIANFLNSVRGLEQPRSPVADARKSALLCHLGNIAQRTDGSLTCDPKNGHIVDDEHAMTYWSREYAPGWEPRMIGGWWLAVEPSVRGLP